MMTPEDLAAKLGESGQSLWECSRAPLEGVRVRTLFLYPDGGILDIFVLERNGYLEVTDFGEALEWLRMQSPDGRLSPEQERCIEEVVRPLGVECLRGQLFSRTDNAYVAAAVLRVAQAVFWVTGLCFTMRIQEEGNSI